MYVYAENRAKITMEQESKYVPTELKSKGVFMDCSWKTITKPWTYGRRSYAGKRPRLAAEY
jgi:hypothetical protein